MKKSTYCFIGLVGLVVAVLSAENSKAQDYVSPVAPTKTGRSPGVKVKLLSTNGENRNYVLVFAPGDEVKSGLMEFALKYHVQNAHFTAIGDAKSAQVGFYDYERKMFKVIPMNEPGEVTSLIGNITMMDDKPVVHAHVNLADSKGIVHGGHLLEMTIGPTLEVFVTTDTAPLNKKTNRQYGAAVIDPDME